MKQQLELDLVLATSSDVVRKLLGYVVLATLARGLSNTDMGELFFAITFATVFATLTELGTNRYLTRKVAQDQQRALDYLAEVLSLRLPALVVAFLLLNAIAFLFLRERAHILLPVSVFVLVGDLYYSFGSLFLGLRRLGYRFATGLIDVALPGGPGLARRAARLEPERGPRLLRRLERNPGRRDRGRRAVAVRTLRARPGPLTAAGCRRRIPSVLRARGSQLRVPEGGYDDDPLHPVRRGGGPPLRGRVTSSSRSPASPSARRPRCSSPSAPRWWLATTGEASARLCKSS